VNLLSERELLNMRAKLQMLEEGHQALTAETSEDEELTEITL
jgi:hypothetical protein